MDLKDILETEKTMHNAWRKRAEEAESALSECLRLLRILAGGTNTSCAYCHAMLGNQHSEQCLIDLLLKEQPLESAAAVDFNSSAASKDGGFLERFG